MPTFPNQRIMKIHKEALGDYDREYPELDLDDDDIEKYNQHVLKETRRK